MGPHGSSRGCEPQENFPGVPPCLRPCPQVWVHPGGGRQGWGKDRQPTEKLLSNVQFIHMKDPRKIFKWMWDSRLSMVPWRKISFVPKILYILLVKRYKTVVEISTAFSEANSKSSCLCIELPRGEEKKEKFRSNKLSETEEVKGS